MSIALLQKIVLCKGYYENITLLETQSHIEISYNHQSQNDPFPPSFNIDWHVENITYKVIFKYDKLKTITKHINKATSEWKNCMSSNFQRENFTILY